MEDWERRWARLGEMPALAELVAERDRRFGEGARRDDAEGLWEREADVDRPPSRSFAGAALIQAGFAEVGSIWQALDDYILLAVR